jgi:hypothetical protein
MKALQMRQPNRRRVGARRRCAAGFALDSARELRLTTSAPGWTAASERLGTIPSDHAAPYRNGYIQGL